MFISRSKCLSCVYLSERVFIVCLSLGACVYCVLISRSVCLSCVYLSERVFIVCLSRSVCLSCVYLSERVFIVVYLSESECLSCVYLSGECLLCVYLSEQCVYWCLISRSVVYCVLSLGASSFIVCLFRERVLCVVYLSGGECLLCVLSSSELFISGAIVYRVVYLSSECYCVFICLSGVFIVCLSLGASVYRVFISRERVFISRRRRVFIVVFISRARFIVCYLSERGVYSVSVSQGSTGGRFC